VDNGAWRAARAKWETEPTTEWKFGDLPEQIVVNEHHGVPVLAHPGLKALPAGVAVRLSAMPEDAAAMTRDGLRRLFEIQLRHDLGWLEKDLKALRMLGTLAVTLVTPDELQSDALESIRRWACDPDRMTVATVRGSVGAAPSLTADRFAAALKTAKEDLRGLVPKLGDWLKEIFTLRLALQTTRQTYPGLADDLAALLPADFLRRTPFIRVQQLPRYLRAMQVRTEKWKRDAAKDAQRASELAPFVAAIRRMSGNVGNAGGAKAFPGAKFPGEISAAAEDFRWLVVEFRVSLFAQELGTTEPVSVVRLQRALGEITGGVSVQPLPSTTSPSKGVAPATAGKKATPLKSLGSLDQLFRK
jgi:ATP-dependent helicase HrpA